jgi:transcription antitermination factor NusA-like protein
LCDALSLTQLYRLFCVYRCAARRQELVVVTLPPAAPAAAPPAGGLRGGRAAAAPPPQPQRRPMLRVSRASPALVTALLFAEVPAIAEGHVSVSGLARKAGQVTKVAIFADAPPTPDGLPPRVAVVGPDGTYIAAVRSALGGEPLHIVTHAPDDLEATVASALWPARIGAVVVGGVPPAGSKLEAMRTAVLAYAVGDDDVAMAVGRGGHNVACAGALACTLTGASLRLFVRPWTEAVDAGIPLRFKDKPSVGWGDARALHTSAWAGRGDKGDKGDSAAPRGGASGGFKPPPRRGAPPAAPEGGGYMSRAASRDSERRSGIDSRSGSRFGGRGGDADGTSSAAAGGFGTRTWGSRTEADADVAASSALAALDAMRFDADAEERAADDAAAAAAAAAAADAGAAGAEQLSWGGYAPPAPQRKVSGSGFARANEPLRKSRAARAADAEADADANARGGFGAPWGGAAAWDAADSIGTSSGGGGSGGGGGFISANDADAGGIWDAIPPRPAAGAAAPAPGAGAARWAAEFDDGAGGGGDDAAIGAWEDLPAEDE